MNSYFVIDSIVQFKIYLALFVYMEFPGAAVLLLRFRYSFKWQIWFSLFKPFSYSDNLNSNTHFITYFLKFLSIHCCVHTSKNFAFCISIDVFTGDKIGEPIHMRLNTTMVFRLWTLCRPKSCSLSSNINSFQLYIF